MPEPPRAPSAERVAVVGGGWAGCAAAVTLARAGVPVTLFERSRTLGGRARRVAIDGHVVDNGQHLLVGAYRQTLALLADVHGAERAARLFRRVPLTLQPFGERRAGRVELRAPRLPAPLHLAGALATARGLKWRDRLRAAYGFRDLARTGFRCPPTQTVAELFAHAPRAVVAALWEPLCLAALNTPPERASAGVFARVLRESFSAPACRSDFLIPAADLSACFPDAVAPIVVERGGEVRTGTAVSGLAREERGVRLDLGATSELYAGVIVAVAPYQLADVVGAAGAAQAAWRDALECVAAYAYESITTIYLRLSAPLPMRSPILRLDDAPGHWLFEHRPAAGAPRKQARGSGATEWLYAVVISAGGPHDAIDHASLAEQVVAQLRRLGRRLPAVAWSRVIAERRATHACTPGLRHPAAGRVAPGLYLAGDYTGGELPPTLEAATRSGVAAARALLAERQRASA